MKNDLSLFDPQFDLFDPFFDDTFFRAAPRVERHMATDVIEHENDYEIVTDVPGLTKEDIKLELEDGDLTISITKNTQKEEKEKKFVRKERHSYSLRRTFYVGNISEEEIKAKLDNGVLHVTVPKEKQQVVTKKTINIE